MRLIAFIEATDVIKDIPKRLDLGLLDIKRRPRPVTPRLSMLSPHMANSRDPMRMITPGTLITLPKPTFKKNLKREYGHLISKIFCFQPIRS
jgi:hypothetical protein